MADGLDCVVLRTPRLLLREWRDEDREPFAAMNQDPLVMKHFPGLMDRAASDASVDRFIGIHAALGYTVWVVEVLDSERGPTSFAGFTGLMPPSFDPPFAHQEPLVEVGWRLCRSGGAWASRPRRRAPASATASTSSALPEILSFTVVANTALARGHGRIGMHYDSEFDHPRAKPDDFWRRHVLYRMAPGDARG